MVCPSAMEISRNSKGSSTCPSHFSLRSCKCRANTYGYLQNRVSRFALLGWSGQAQLFARPPAGRAVRWHGEGAGLALVLGRVARDARLAQRFDLPGALGELTLARKIEFARCLRLTLGT